MLAYICIYTIHWDPMVMVKISPDKISTFRLDSHKRHQKNVGTSLPSPRSVLHSRRESDPTSDGPFRVSSFGRSAKSVGKKNYIPTFCFAKSPLSLMKPILFLDGLWVDLCSEIHGAPFIGEVLRKSNTLWIPCNT